MQRNAGWRFLNGRAGLDREFCRGLGCVADMHRRAQQETCNNTNSFSHSAATMALMDRLLNRRTSSNPVSFRGGLFVGVAPTKMICSIAPPTGSAGIPAGQERKQAAGPFLI
jgi:hypothetical protein